MDTDRRRLLAGIGAVLATSPALGACLRDALHRTDRELAATFPELPGSVSLGQAYLELYPGEASVETLEYLLLRDCPATGQAIDAAACIEAIAAAHLDDCERVDMVTLEGFVLSRSECRLYALNALLA